MTILGCSCLNVLIHIDEIYEGRNTAEEDLLEVKLTLDGINIQQHFLVDYVIEGRSCTVVKCKICNRPTHKKVNQQIFIYPDLVDYTLNVLAVQNQPNFSSAFNLILPSFSGELNTAAPELPNLKSESHRIKKEMKLLYDEKLAQFIKNEKQLLDKNIKEVDIAEATISRLVSRYERSADVPAAAAAATVPAEDEIETELPTTPRQLSDRRVTFSVEKKTKVSTQEKSPVAQDAFFQFDMVEEDVFAVHSPASEDEEEEEESEGEEASSSSGCEPDLVVGKSVPINVPMNLNRESYQNSLRTRRLSSSAKDSGVEDIAHSMKAMMENFYGGPEEDRPRPRVSRSYNPSRFMRL